MLPFEIPVIAFLPQLDFDPKTEEYYIPEYMMKRNSLYLNKISKEGGSILNLDFQSDLDSIKDVDGWLIPGGADIDPSLYNEQKRTETVCHKLGRDRANLERKIFEKMPLQVPILGICYGTQIINVLKGGTLTQHVDNHCKGAKYPIKIEKNSLLYEIVGEETISSHCNHHQIANIIGKDLIVNCKDDNGMIHGIESTAEGRWIVTVQWHPERCEDQFNDRIFKGFLEKCKAYKKKKNEKIKN